MEDHVNRQAKLGTWVLINARWYNCRESGNGKDEPMIIDWHTHIAAPRMREDNIVEGNWPGTVENVLRLHDEVAWTGA